MALLAGFASAGTVTLTGTCGAYNSSANAIPFRLSNSGNDSAYNLVIYPRIQNVQLSSAAYSIPNLGPASNALLNISVAKVTERGMAGAYFSAAYQQGSTVFTAVFPCLIPLLNITASQVFLSAVPSVSANGNATVNVKASNYGLAPVTANITLLLPPTFAFKSSSFFIASLEPSSSANFTFRLSFPAGEQAAYAAGALSSYSSGNLSYASLSTFVLSSPKEITASFSPFIVWIAAAVLALVVVLIILSFSRKRKPQNDPVQQHNPVLQHDSGQQHEHAGQV